MIAASTEHHYDLALPIIAFGVIDPWLGQRAVDEVKRCHEELGMRGIGDGISTTVPVRDGVVNWDKKRAAQLFGALADDETPPKGSLGP